MALPNHSTLELSVFEMVLIRLPFLENTPANEELAASYTLEIMMELEPCFRVNAGLTIPPDTSRIGDENQYTVLQRTIVADLVSYYILFRLSVVQATGDPTSGTVPLTSFLKSAKAGSVEVEFEQVDVNKSNLLASSISSMLDMFKHSAIRRARSLGCTIDICDDCTTAVGCSLDMRPASFIVTNVNCTDEPYEHIPEQG